MTKGYKKRIQAYIPLFVYLFIMFYITVLTRTPTLRRSAHFVPLWSFLDREYWQQILLNVALFVPMGYYLTDALSDRRHTFIWSIIIALSVSASIEIIQFVSYRGTMDVDDLISNVAGALLGASAWSFLHDAWRIKTAYIFLIAGFIGCIISTESAAKNNIVSANTQQFEFNVMSVSDYDGIEVIEGQCFLYDRDTPDYVILLDGCEAETLIEGNRFTAKAQVTSKVEIKVKFAGFPAMSTGVWLNKDRIEYVSGVLPIIRGLPHDVVLKSWNREYDVLVYQEKDRLLWLIGTSIDQDTEVIYHIHTSEPDSLPENRTKYKFDNRGFRVCADKKVENELESIEHYRVFERKIPKDYSVTAVVVGFNTDGIITWSDSFRIDKSVI